MHETPDFTNERVMEKYSSAFTLSDMEIFVFPELFYPLVLSNIMSPIIWQWREDPWFADISQKSFTYKANRIKQYIMDHYTFNLDLETWGLTNKDVEMDRFSQFVDMDILRQSNALFGYEGDKYYFDMDIRSHFGLDKFTTDTIPYWKTETVEAMTAFRYKQGYTTGAGECVSLSALYAAAMFIVGRIPLDNIFLVATPLHSQNFIDINEGLITNNRRIVTKNMWFNGTVLTDKARRALEKERVTIVAHISGYIHRIYDKATIAPDAYKRFDNKLRNFLKTDLTFASFIGFLRLNKQFCMYFQYRQMVNGQAQYIAMERIFELEQNIQLSFSEQNAKSFMLHVSNDEFISSVLIERIVLQDVEAFLAQKNENKSRAGIVQALLEMANRAGCIHVSQFEALLSELFTFIEVEPRLPEPEKQFENTEMLDIPTNKYRDEIIEYISEKAGENEVARLAMYTYRQMDTIDWQPFVKAALERNPLSIAGLSGTSIQDAYQIIARLLNESVYDSNRLALPDEVWNFQRGDGVEKAFLFANYILSLDKNDRICLKINKDAVQLIHNQIKYSFLSSKSITKELKLSLCCKEYLCRYY